MEGWYGIEEAFEVEERVSEVEVKIVEDASEKVTETLVEALEE